MIEPSFSSHGEGHDAETVKTLILVELSDLKEAVQAFGIQSIKDGTWFTKFLQSCLTSYEQKISEQGGVAYLREKYPGLPTDAVAAKLCELAEHYAAVAGGLSGAAASAAVVTAGMGTAAAITGIMVEVFYTVRLQLRLMYDLHLLYGIPLNSNDPEELMRLFGVIYGVKAAEVGGLGVKAYGPEVVRAQLFRLINGNTPVIQAAAKKVLGPRIAKQITQKAIIKAAVPIVGVGISAGWNYATTRMLGVRVRHDVRVIAALKEETQRLQGNIGRNEKAEKAILEGLMALALADCNFDDKEQEVYQAFLKQLSLPGDDVQQLAEKIDVDLEETCAALKTIQDPTSQEAVARSFCLIAAADGELQSAEQKVLEQLLEALGQSQLVDEVSEIATRFRREDGAVDQALLAVGEAANRAGEKVGEAISWAGKLFNRDKQAEVQPAQVEFEMSAEEKTSAMLLAAMETLTQRFALGKLCQEDYKSQFALLMGQLKG